MFINQVLSLIIWCFFITISHAGCIQFKKGQCIRCWYDHILIDGQCYHQIAGCIQYKNPTTCGKCNSTISYLNEKQCVLYETHTLQSMPIIKFNLTLYKLAYYDGFYYLSINDALLDSYFMTCNKYLYAGQYKHFLSKSQKAFRYIGVTYKQDNWNGYKIIYEGSGGGLLLCLIDINTKTLSILIKSIVSIGRTKVRPFCRDYNFNSQCILCQDDYHLQNSICSRNIEGCTTFYGNICLKCRNYMVLVENRCISSCIEQKDLNRIPFFHKGLIKQLMEVKGSSPIC